MGKRQIPLWGKILIGLILGVITGIILREKSLYLKPIGTIFINAIKMVIIPLVFSSLIVGVTSIEDISRMGRIGLKAAVIFALTTAFAVCIGFLFSWIINPGLGVKIAANLTTAQTAQQTSMLDTIVNIIPSNPIGSLAKGEILQVIVFAIFIGISINLTNPKSRPVKLFFNGLAEVMYKLTAIIMGFAPYGVFALIASVVGQYGIEFLIPLFKVIATVYLACITHAIIIYGGMLLFISRLNPFRFFSGFLDATLIAFSTSSSSATLPVSLRCTQMNLGVSKSIASFVLPLGTTINMNGTAIYQGVCAVFIAQAFGLNLSIMNYVTIVLTSILAAIGTAGVPGAGLIMLSLVLSSVGLPIEGIAIIAGIDRILDMARSVINVMGDALASVVIAKSENELNLDTYNTLKVYKR